ncbi:hypothetical protein F9K91_22500 [Brucella tritici]|uniref:Uncharacterized protein n=1 Tax=Brucella tritici TaxID=94626 RepID=A0A833FIC9_9HYPH|nr:hypothetical protein [Brucella tritici]KAB2662420.1 hypothetical protein F9K91_22500 [Brucella tritici]KAB2697672.1 hypothetical protein F9K79_16670 [Ochrobactrum sp. Kaboul]
MSENSPIGHVILMKNEVPRRHPGRGLNAALQLSELHNRINKQERDPQSTERVDEYFRYAIWSEGEKIIGYLESIISVADERTSTTTSGIPISSSSMRKLVGALSEEAEGIMHYQPSLTPTYLSGGFAFDLIVYDLQQKCLRYIHIAYGIGNERSAQIQWEEDKAKLASFLPRIGTQYFGVEIERTEFVTIDPLLNETKYLEGVWALHDLDQLTGRSGTAQHVLEIQRQQRHMLSFWFSNSLSGSEMEKHRQLNSIFHRLAHEELKRAKPLHFQTLVPDRAL